MNEHDKWENFLLCDICIIVDRYRVSRGAKKINLCMQVLPEQAIRPP
jgi:hypothetical protein